MLIYTSKMVRLAIKRPTRITQTWSPYGGFFAKSCTRWKKMWLILVDPIIHRVSTKNVLLVKIGLGQWLAYHLSLFPFNRGCFFKPFNSSTNQWEFGTSMNFNMFQPSLLWCSGISRVPIHFGRGSGRLQDGSWPGGTSGRMTWGDWIRQGRCDNTTCSY